MAKIPNHLQHLNVINGRGILALPGVKDAHIHLDKTYYGGPWTAAAENKNCTGHDHTRKDIITSASTIFRTTSKGNLKFNFI